MVLLTFVLIFRFSGSTRLEQNNFLEEANIEIWTLKIFHTGHLYTKWSFDFAQRDQCRIGSLSDFGKFLSKFNVFRKASADAFLFAHMHWLHLTDTSTSCLSLFSTSLFFMFLFIYLSIYLYIHFSWVSGLYSTWSTWPPPWTSALAGVWEKVRAVGF